MYYLMDCIIKKYIYEYIQVFFAQEKRNRQYLFGNS